MDLAGARLRQERERRTPLPPMLHLSGDLLDGAQSEAVNVDKTVDEIALAIVLPFGGHVLVSSSSTAFGSLTIFRSERFRPPSKPFKNDSQDVTPVSSFIRFQETRPRPRAVWHDHRSAGATGRADRTEQIGRGEAANVEAMNQHLAEISRTGDRAPRAADCRAAPRSKSMCLVGRPGLHLATRSRLADRRSVP